MTKQRIAWPVADAKSRFSEVIDLALSAGPQTISRHGKPVAVVVSADEWQRKVHRKGNLADFFKDSPLRGSGLTVKRKRDRPRSVDL